MIVCICRVVTDKTIRAAVALGADTVEKVGQSCRAGTGCGACREQIAEIIEDCRGAACPNAAICLSAGAAAARPAAHPGTHAHTDSPAKEAA